MHSATVAVFWEVWKRHRWVSIASTVWLLAVSCLCYALSDGVILGASLPADRHEILFLRFLAIAPLVIWLFPLFAYAVGADIAGRESSFPARMFTMPLSTCALVGWPMFYGTATIALVWLAAASLTMRSGGVAVALWWPAALLAALLAWVQALVWRPFSLPGMRLVAPVVPIGALVTVLSLRWSAHLSELVVSLLLAGTIPLAFGVAVAGVARARRGDQLDRQWLVGCVTNVADRFLPRGRGFRSASRAQVWFELRRRGLAPVIVAGLTLLLLATLVIVDRHNPDLSTSSPLRSALLLLTAPIWTAMSVGSSWGNCGTSRREQTISVFLATRPITSAGLIWAKMKATAISTGIIWAMATTATVLLVLWTGSWGELAGQWNQLAGVFSSMQTAALVILGVILLPAATWKPLIACMFLDLAGRKWLRVLGVFVVSFVLSQAVLIYCWISMHPEYHDDLWAAVPWALESLAALKLLLGAWLVRAVVQRRLIAPRLMRRLLIAWLLVAVGLTGLLCWLVPYGLAPWHLVAACVVLALPLVRISLAPLALAWNRHR